MDPAKAGAPRGPGLARALGPLAYGALLFALLLAAESAGRALLVAAFFDRVGRVPGWSELLVLGLRMDAVVASLCVAPVVILLLAVPRAWTLRGERLLCAYFAVVLTAVVLMEAVSFDFIEEYDNRPNRIFVEYLDGSKEVAGTLVSAYLSHLLAAAALGAAVFAGGWRLASVALRRQAPWSPVRRAAHALLLLPVFYVGLRGTLDHRPVNPSTVAFSGEHLLNQLALNSTYSALYAAYSMRGDRIAGELYGDMPEAEILARVARYTEIAGRDRVPGDAPFLHVQRPGARVARPRNLVIVLQESLGARYVGSLGGLPLTPHFDALSREGLLLTRLYATGTRKGARHRGHARRLPADSGQRGGEAPAGADGLLHHGGAAPRARLRHRLRVRRREPLRQHGGLHARQRLRARPRRVRLGGPRLPRHLGRVGRRPDAQGARDLRRPRRHSLLRARPHHLEPLAVRLPGGPHRALRPRARHAAQRDEVRRSRARPAVPPGQAGRLLREHRVGGGRRPRHPRARQPADPGVEVPRPRADPRAGSRAGALREGGEPDRPDADGAAPARDRDHPSDDRPQPVHPVRRRSRARHPPVLRQPRPAGGRSAGGARGLAPGALLPLRRREAGSRRLRPELARDALAHALLPELLYEQERYRLPSARSPSVRD
jgi:hypothetical protein